MMPQHSPTTRLTLLGALGQGLRWEEFLALYGRLILHWARRFGLQESDALDVRQQVLIRVWKSIHRYDPVRGRFRGWLYACTRNVVLSLYRRSVPCRTWSGSEREIPAPAADGSVLGLAWEEEDPGDGLMRHFDDEGFANAPLEAAVREVRQRVQPRTWKAFLLFEFLELSAKEIAPLVQLSPAAVNQAVHRVRQLLETAFQSASQPDMRSASGRHGTPVA